MSEELARVGDDHQRRIQLSNLADDLLDMVPMERVEAHAEVMRELLGSIVTYARQCQSQILDSEQL